MDTVCGRPGRPQHKLGARAFRRQFPLWTGGSRVQDMVDSHWTGAMDLGRSLIEAVAVNAASPNELARDANLAASPAGIVDLRHELLAQGVDPVPQTIAHPSQCGWAARLSVRTIWAHPKAQSASVKVSPRTARSSAS